MLIEKNRELIKFQLKNNIPLMEAQNMIENGTIDIIALGFQRTEVREARFNFSKSLYSVSFLDFSTFKLRYSCIKKFLLGHFLSFFGTFFQKTNFICWNFSASKLSYPSGKNYLFYFLEKIYLLFIVLLEF